MLRCLRYKLEPNNVILGGEDQATLIEDLKATFQVRYSAGGATQNVMRVAQHMLVKPKSCAFLGSVGYDQHGAILLDQATADGLDAIYEIEPSDTTGVCAVLLTDKGRNRSLVSFIAAAAIFNRPHLLRHWPVVERAAIYYCSGFSIRTGFEAVMEMATHAGDSKSFAINLSAPYVCVTFTDRLTQLMPYVDLLFGNDDEARALAGALKWEVSADTVTVVLTVLLADSRLGRYRSSPCSTSVKQVGQQRRTTGHHNAGRQTGDRRLWPASDQTLRATSCEGAYCGHEWCRRCIRRRLPGGVRDRERPR